MQEIIEYLQKVQAAKKSIAFLNDEQKNTILHSIADALIEKTPTIAQANAQDISSGRENGLTEALLDRLLLDAPRIRDIADSLRTIASLKDPVTRTLEGWALPNGLRVQKVSIPIGVIGIIYEARPNVTTDVAALCLKSGNVCILKGGKEAKHSNATMIQIIQEVLRAHNVSEYCVSAFADSSRESVTAMLKQDKYIDLIIPRGGEGLIRYVSENSTIPVLKHDKGVCNIFVDESANIQEAIDITVNAKTRRPGVCNALECMIVHQDIASIFLPLAKKAFDAKQTLLKGCTQTKAIIDIELIDSEAYHIEYLDNILNIKVVDSLQEAIEHIETYGSGHSDSIVTRRLESSRLFCQMVDSACVYVNASTSFTDGGQFGFGAEVGISTAKLHARGPMGVDDLTTYKFVVMGEGQIRA